MTLARPNVATAAAPMHSNDDHSARSKRLCLLELQQLFRPLRGSSVSSIASPPSPTRPTSSASDSSIGSTPCSPTRSPTSDDLARLFPELVNHPDYEPVSLIGGGAYAQVCGARNKLTNQMVAIKRIDSVFCDSREAARTIREVQLLRHFRGSSHIVKLLDIIHTKDLNNVLLVFELLDGTLHQHIHSGTTSSSVETRRHYLLQLLLALRELHSVQVVHRDLRPKNILINGKQLKLCDFGMARTISLRMSLLQNTTNTYYCAPEGLLNHTRYTTASDMWSLGIIMAEMIHGSVLLRGSSDMDQLRMIFSVLGRPCDEQLQRMTTELQYEMLRDSPEKPENSLETRLPGATELEIDLIKQLLEIDPERRITAEQALMHPLFAGIELEPLTMLSPPPVESTVSMSSPTTTVDLRAKLAVEVGLARQPRESATGC